MVEPKVMSDEDKTRDQLIRELADLRSRLVKQEWLLRAFENHPDALVISRLKDGRIERINSAFVDLFGYSPGEAVGTCSVDFHMIEESERRHIVAELESKGVIRARHVDVKTRAGALRNVALSAVKIGTGESGRIMTIIQDFTGQKNIEEGLRQAEESLRASERQHRRIIETANEGIWVIDQENRTTFVNPRMAAMLGCPMEEMSSASLFDFIDSDWEAVASKNVERRRAGTAEQHEFKFRRKDGSTFWAIVSTNPIHDENGTYIGALGMITDITERKKSEEALRDSEERLKATLRSTADEIWIADTQGRIVSISNSVMENLGVNSDKWADVKAAIDQLEIFRPDGSPRPRKDNILPRALRGEVIKNEAEVIRNREFTVRRATW